jgi:hypothetical protein
MDELGSVDLLTQKEAAVMLRMSESWLERKRWEGKSIPYTKIGGRVFYDKIDVIKWLKKQKKQS